MSHESLSQSEMVHAKPRRREVKEEMKTDLSEVQNILRAFASSREPSSQKMPELLTWRIRLVSREAAKNAKV
jgi:hypothetical protein